jgi:hypothetical protein
MSAPLSASDIRARQTATKERLSALSSERRALALAAAEGDARASDRIVVVSSEIARLTADVAILDDALHLAQQRAEAEREADRRRAAAARAERARQLVGALETAASECDRLAAALVHALDARRGILDDLHRVGIDVRRSTSRTRSHRCLAASGLLEHLEGAPVEKAHRTSFVAVDGALAATITRQSGDAPQEAA